MINVVSRSAEISPCGRYRYMLHRAATRWTIPTHRAIAFCMLNPSIADATLDDPTIRRCRGFAERWGCNGLVVVNLYALRSTQPRLLRDHPDPVGPDNDQWIRAAARDCGNVVCAWGTNARAERVRHVVEIIRSAGASLLCIGTTKDGHPRHPLYARCDAPLVPWELAP